MAKIIVKLIETDEHIYDGYYCKKCCFKDLNNCIEITEALGFNVTCETEPDLCYFVKDSK